MFGNTKGYADVKGYNLVAILPGNELLERRTDERVVVEAFVT